MQFNEHHKTEMFIETEFKRLNSTKPLSVITHENVTPHVNEGPSGSSEGPIIVKGTGQGCSSNACVVITFL